MNVEYTSAVPAGFTLLTKTSEKLLAAPVLLKAPGRRREIGRLRRADHIRVACGVDLDAGGELVARAAEEGGVFDPRIDDQFVIRTIAGTDREAVFRLPAAPVRTT